MSHISIDIETYSGTDISKAGLYKYAQDPDFTVLLFAYAVDGGPVYVIDLTDKKTLPYEIMELLFDRENTLHAYNAAFEWYCLSRYFQLTEEAALGWLPRWRCTMLHGMYLGYPAGLAACGAALGLPQDAQKDRQGKALIRTFCVPCEPTARNGHRTRTLPRHEPDRWELFMEYNRQDVVAERAIEAALSMFPVPDKVQREWELDLEINLRGINTDEDMIYGALSIISEVNAELLEEAERITGLANPNSRAQLITWLTEETGEELTTLRKEDVAELLAKGLTSDAAVRMLEIRQELSRTSLKKYDALREARCADGRVRGSLMFYGANRTGRWAGRIIQPQNLPRTHLPAIDFARELVRGCKKDALRVVYGSVPDTLSQLLRTVLIPAEGTFFIDADFSAIEARVVAWLAGETWVLDVFRTHGRIYEATASQMFGVPIEKIKKGNPEYELRQRGKVATLALGYGGGVGALTAMGALRMGIPEDDLQDIVDRWRAANPNIARLWKSVEGAVLSTMRTGQVNALPHITISLRGCPERGWLVITLPSGRELFYACPSFGSDRWGRESFVYRFGKDFKPTETWGGKLVENIVQAVARDCLAESIRRLEAEGYRIVFHVHDEVVIEAREGQTLEDVCAIMGQVPAWADGLPLSADGWTGNYYTKD